VRLSLRERERERELLLVIIDSKSLSCNYFMGKRTVFTRSTITPQKLESEPIWMKSGIM